MDIYGYAKYKIFFIHSNEWQYLWYKGSLMTKNWVLNNRKQRTEDKDSSNSTIG